MSSQYNYRINPESIGDQVNITIGSAKSATSTVAESDIQIVYYTMYAFKESGKYYCDGVVALDVTNLTPLHMKEALFKGETGLETFTRVFIPHSNNPQEYSVPFMIPPVPEGDE